MRPTRVRPPSRRQRHPGAAVGARPRRPPRCGLYGTVRPLCAARNRRCRHGGL